MHVVSMMDIVDLFKDAQVVQHYGLTMDQVGLEKALYLLGLNTVKSYSCTKVNHRSEISGKIGNCERYVGKERTDDNWLKIKQLVKET